MPTMAAAGSTDTMHVHHVEEFSTQEWEDEAVNTVEGGSSAAASGTEKGGKGKRRMSAVLRSSLSSLGGLRISSVTEREGSKTAATKPNGRESTTGFVGTLLHGVANAIGLHRDGSQAGDVSPSGPSNKALSSQSRNIARLSSAADMRAEMRASLGTFGDLRNDSFSSPTAVKLMRRGSQLRTSDAGGCAAPTRPPFRTAASGDLLRNSTNTPSGAPAAPSGRLSTPTEAAAAAAASTTFPSNAPASPFRRPRSAAPTDVPCLLPDAVLDSCSGAPMLLPLGAPPQRSPSGAGSVTGRLGSVTDMPRLQGPGAMHPHPPQGPVGLSPRPPGAAPVSGSSPSRSSSTDHLPPMASPGGLSVRDRPPTPRGGRTSISGGIGAVLGSIPIHLPEILSSGKSITERRASITGEPGATSRSRRNSVSGPPGVRPSGPSIVGINGGLVQGPGGAAINASLAKRAAAAIAVGVAVPSPGSSLAGTPVMSPAGLPPPSPSPQPPPGLAAAMGSSAGKGTASAGILRDFNSSHDLEEDGGLAAVDADFDRRFRQPSSGGPAGGPRPETASSGELPSGSQRPPSVRGALQPHAPRGERNTSSGNPRRPNPSWAALPTAFASSSPGATSPGEAVPATAAAASPFLPPHHPRRQSCSATMFSAGSGGVSGSETVYGSGPPAGEQVLVTSLDAIPPLSPPPTLDARGRLASIRLSYAEGIVGTHAEGGGGSGGGATVPIAPCSGRRASLDLPPAVGAAAAAAHGQGSSSSAWPQSPGLGVRPVMPAIAAGASRISP